MSTVLLSGSWGGPFPLLLGRPASVSFSVDDQDAFLEVAGQVPTGSSWRGALDAVRPDGSTVRLDVACARLRRDGFLAGLV